MIKNTNVRDSNIKLNRYHVVNTYYTRIKVHSKSFSIIVEIFQKHIQELIKQLNAYLDIKC